MLTRSRKRKAWPASPQSSSPRDAMDQACDRAATKKVKTINESSSMHSAESTDDSVGSVYQDNGSEGNIDDMDISTISEISEISDTSHRELSTREISPEPITGTDLPSHSPGALEDPTALESSRPLLANLAKAAGFRAAHNEQALYNKMFVDPTASMQLKQLRSKDIVRQLQFNTHTKNASRLPVREIHSLKSAHVMGLVGFMVGKLSATPCLRCAREEGHLSPCVYVPGYFDNACTNCVFSHFSIQQHCTLKHEKIPLTDLNDESSINEMEGSQPKGNVQEIKGVVRMMFEEELSDLIKKVVRDTMKDDLQVIVGPDTVVIEQRGTDFLLEKEGIDNEGDTSMIDGEDAGEDDANDNGEDDSEDDGE